MRSASRRWAPIVRRNFPRSGLEVFEAGDPADLDAEMAALAWRSAAAGGRDDLTLLMGDVGLFAAFVDALDLAAPARDAPEAGVFQPPAPAAPN